MMLSAAATGFASSLSLILAIGAQNAFVLRQGLLRSHVLPLVLFCGASDALLIALGVAGFGWAVASVPWLPAALAWAGAAFLVCYAALRLRAAVQGSYALALGDGGGSLGSTLATAGAITWLNPHVYLDTLALLGAISTGFEGGERTAFALGAMSASFAFFAALGYGARLLAPVMTSVRAWQVLDAVIALIMILIAVGLVRSTL